MLVICICLSTVFHNWYSYVMRNVQTFILFLNAIDYTYISAKNNE